MNGKVIYHSPNANTYVNIIAAIFETYDDVKQITISFIDSQIDEDFIDSLQEKLMSYCDENPLYKRAARVHLRGESVSLVDVSSNEDVDVIDVTAISKEMAIEVIAANIDKKKLKVCTLQWDSSTKFKKGEKWVLRDGNHLYSNLVSKGSLSKLYQNHWQKKQVMWLFVTIFIALIVMAVAKYTIPSFVVPSDIVNVLSLLVGAAGLYLATLSLKADKA